MNSKSFDNSENSEPFLGDNADSDSPSAEQILDRGVHLADPIDEHFMQELLQEFHSHQRFGPADIHDRVEALAGWEERAIELVAISEDGRKDTLSAGGILALLTHWRHLCENHGLVPEAEDCRTQSRAAVREAAGLRRDELRSRSAADSPELLFDELLHTTHLILESQRRAPGAVDAVETLREAMANQRADLLRVLGLSESLTTSTSSDLESPSATALEDRVKDKEVLDEDESDEGQSDEEQSDEEQSDEEQSDEEQSDEEQSTRPFETDRNSTPGDNDTGLGDDRLDRWSRLIADQVDSLMTSIDDLSPNQATAQIDLTIDILDWHVRNLDTRRKSRAVARLKRKRRRLLAERQERQLQATMERKFSRGFVTFMERAILVLISVVLGLMFVEWTFTLAPETKQLFLYIDAGCCVIFLAEFFLKFGMVKNRWYWFRRHFFVDFVPSIPVGLLTSGIAAPGDVVRTGRLARFLRLPRLVRYIRILRPLVRVLRALGLMARGIDRLARRYGRAINCNVILCPTHEEVEKYIRSLPEETATTKKLWRRIRDEWSRLLAESPVEYQPEIAQRRIDILAHAIATKAVSFESGTTHTGARDIPAEALLDRMEAMDADSIEATLGDGMVTQLARVVRTLSSFPWRYLPIIRKCLPKDIGKMQDGEAVAASSRATARYFRRFHDGWYWIADLYGTVTPSQFVDRVGGMLVKSSFRPAYRLVLFGGFLLLTELLFVVASIPVLEPVRHFLKNFVGTTVLLLGSICFLVLALGWWLQRVAQEATEFYERSVQAQFLGLTESIRTARLRDDAAVLLDRVLLPDWPRSDDRTRDEKLDEFTQQLEQSLIHTNAVADRVARFPFLDRLVLLYRDWLTGPMFTSGDTRATNQLLGNTALRQLLLSSERIDKKSLKQMQRLDLDKQKSLFKGPFIWFNFVSKSVAHSVACLLVDYNRKAIPLHEFDHCSDEQRQTYQLWLNPDEKQIGELPKNGPVEESKYVTTAFTALNFLDTSSHRDAEIETRFGTQVLKRLQRDRSLMMRRIFGTLPMHERPRDERVVNLYSFYEHWIAKGRVFLVPWFVFVLMLKLFGRFVAWVYRSVQEIRHPDRRTARMDAAHAEFSVAVRKINRIRGPVAEQCILLRAAFDPAYLQVPLPGESETRLFGADAEFDLPFLDPSPVIEQQLEIERRRAENNMVRLENLIKDGLLERIAATHGEEAHQFKTRQHLRAAAIAIHADLNGIRSHLFADSLLNEVYRTTEAKPAFGDRLSVKLRLRSQFNRYWEAFGLASTQAKRRAWRATLENENGVATALNAWASHGEQVVQEGERLLGQLLLHPGRVSEQLMTLRMVQTLTLLDIQHYREQIHRLGKYDEDDELTETTMSFRKHATQHE